MVVLPSPFGSGKNEPKLLVIHAMGEWIHDGNYYHAPDYLVKLGLSCHYLITPSGVIIKTREEHQTAWHAKGFNTHSIGIEFLVQGVHNYETFLKAIRNPYLSDDQIKSGLDLISGIRRRYPGIEIKRHSDLDPARKSDPGEGFQFEYFINLTDSE